MLYTVAIQENPPGVSPPKPRPVFASELSDVARRVARRVEAEIKETGARVVTNLCHCGCGCR